MSLSLSSLLTTTAALGAVICAILFAAHVLRRTGLAGTSATTRLRLRESLSLDRTRRLHLVACDDRDLLVLAGPNGDMLVGWMPALPGDAAQ